MGSDQESMTYGDSHSNRDKEHVYSETDRYGSRIIAELIVESVRNSASHPERKCHAQGTHRQSDSPITYQKAEVNLKADQEQEQNETDVGDEGQVWNGGGGEYGIREARDMPHG